MAEKIAPYLKPLISDINDLNMGIYLASSEFERLAIKHKFAKLWDDILIEVERNRKSIWLGKNPKIRDSEKGMVILLNRTFQAGLPAFSSIFYHIFMGYLTWNNNEVSIESIFEDLTLLKFPDELLEELKAMYYEKQRKLKEEKEKQIIENEEEERIVVDTISIFKTKRVEWIEMIAKSEIEDAINDVKQFISDNIQEKDVSNEIVNLSSRWYRLNKKIRHGVLDLDNEHIEANKINNALIEIIDLMERKISK